MQYRVGMTVKTPLPLRLPTMPLCQDEGVKWKRRLPLKFCSDALSGALEGCVRSYINIRIFNMNDRPIYRMACLCCRMWNS